MPSSFAIVDAVSSLSPVSMITSIFLSFKCLIVTFAEGLGVSKNAIIPTKSFSIATREIVFP